MEEARTTAGRRSRARFPTNRSRAEEARVDVGASALTVSSAEEESPVPDATVTKPRPAVRFTRGRLGRTVLAATIAGLGTTGVAAAAVSGTTNVISSCVDMAGKVRILDNSGVVADYCRSGEKSLQWNKTGPQGPQGPVGPQGAVGPQGVPGPAGTGTLHLTSAGDQGHKTPINGSPTILTLDLPPGNYSVVARIAISGHDEYGNGSTSCSIEEKGFTVDENVANGDTRQLTLIGAVKSEGEPTTISLHCTENPWDLKWAYAKMMAAEVSAVSNSW